MGHFGYISPYSRSGQLPLRLKAKKNITVLTWEFPVLNVYLLVQDFRLSQSWPYPISQLVLTYKLKITCSHICAYHSAQLTYTMQHGTVLIIFTLNLQAVTTTQTSIHNSLHQWDEYSTDIIPLAICSNAVGRPILQSYYNSLLLSHWPISNWHYFHQQ